MISRTYQAILISIFSLQIFQNTLSEEHVECVVIKFFDSLFQKYIEAVKVMEKGERSQGCSSKVYRCPTRKLKRNRKLKTIFRYKYFRDSVWNGMILLYHIQSTLYPFTSLPANLISDSTTSEIHVSILNFLGNSLPDILAMFIFLLR